MTERKTEDEGPGKSTKQYWIDQKKHSDIFEQNQLSDEIEQSDLATKQKVKDFLNERSRMAKTPAEKGLPPLEG